jgi:hypothetical protein
VYENLNYQHAGLCRSSLDVSLAAEVSARDAIARAMRVVKSNPVNPGETNGQG